MVADVDEQGRSRVRWSVRPNYLAAVLLTAAVGCGLYFAVGQLIQDLAGAWANGAKGGVMPKHFVEHLVLACVLGSFFAIFAYAVGRVLIYGPTLHRITFGPDALYFEPPLIDEELRRVKQVSRSELGAIRLQPLRVRQSVTIDRGVWRLDTGAWLAYEDRAWLAVVLRAWAGRQERNSPDHPAPARRLVDQG